MLNINKYNEYKNSYNKLNKPNNEPNNEPNNNYSIKYIKKYILEMIDNKKNNKQIFELLFIYIKNYFENNLNIYDIEIIKNGFFNLFFERIIFIKNNDYIPNYIISFEFINYFGYENEFNDSILYILNNYKIIKNPFYIDFRHKNYKIILKNILNIIDNILIGSSKEILQNNIKRINTLHNFSNKNNHTKHIVTKISQNNILANSKIKDIMSKSKIELLFLNIIKKYIKNKKNKYIQFKNFNSIKTFHKILIDLDSVLIINDANGYKDIIIFLSKLKGSNLLREKINNMKNKLNELFEYTNIKTYGMLCDSFDEMFGNSTQKNLRNYYHHKLSAIKIYNNDTYNKILCELFGEFDFIKDIIRFNLDKVMENKFEFTITYNLIEYTFSFNIKIFNTIDCIKNFLNYLLNKNVNISGILIYRKKSFEEYKNLVKTLYLILFYQDKTFDEIKLIFENYNYANNNDNIHKKLRTIISFILRFKMIGDQLQANEARKINSNLSFENNEYHNYNRIITTQDRVLATYCMIEEDIMFISKYTDNKISYLLYNIF